MDAHTKIDRIEISWNGTIQLRVAKEVWNGEVQVFSEWHRGVLYPNAPVGDQITALNTHLGELGFPPITTEDTTLIQSISATVWTPELLADWANAEGE